MATRPTAVPRDPRQHARAIAEAVDAAWHGAFGGSRAEIPLSVVAALTLIGKTDPDGRDTAARILALDPGGFAAMLGSLWAQFAIVRPDLLPRVRLLFRWLDEDPEEYVLRAAHAAGTAAVKAGQMQLTGVDRGRCEIDLLGIVFQVVRSRSARGGRGQFLSPQCVADAVGDMVATETIAGLADDLLDQVARAAAPSVLEPCAGTGTMLLGAAKAIRARGGDPTRYRWLANDIDPLAAALLAVNVHLWRLGPNVLVGCGDGLTNDWVETAATQRADAIAEVQRLWHDARKIAAFKALLGLVEPAGDHQPAPAARPPAVVPEPVPAKFTAGTFRQQRLF